MVTGDCSCFGASDREARLLALIVGSRVWGGSSKPAVTAAQTSSKFDKKSTEKLYSCVLKCTHCNKPVESCRF